MKTAELLGRARGYYEEFIEALQDYRRGRERVYAVERLAQLIAQAVLDLAAILASREAGAKPETYRGLAQWLARRAGLDKELTEFLLGLAGFRNILVHMYAEIDPVLEEEAFNEIAEKTPRLLRALEELAQGDPCLEELRPKIVEVAKRLGIRLVLVFGSLASRGCGHDVDLAVKLGRRPRSLIELGRLQAMLEDELGAPVDLVVLDLELDPAIAKTIVDEAVLVYGDRREAEEELLRLYKHYLDKASSSLGKRVATGPRGSATRG